MVPFFWPKNPQGNAVEQSAGLGFLMDAKKHECVVTARHVVEDKGTGQLEDVRIRIGKVIIESKKVRETLGSDWVFHPNKDVDLAVLPLPPKFEKPERGIWLPDSIIAASPKAELGDDVVFGSLPFNQPFPIVLRKGMVAHIDEAVFLIDGQVFPGSSGSPVFLFQKPLKFLGIVVAYRPYEDYAISQQTGDLRAVYVENSGIGVAHTSKALQEVIESEEFAKTSKMLG